MTNEDWHTACGTADRANRLRQRAAKQGPARAGLRALPIFFARDVW